MTNLIKSNDIAEPTQKIYNTYLTEFINVVNIIFKNNNPVPLDIEEFVGNNSGGFSHIESQQQDMTEYYFKIMNYFDDSSIWPDKNDKNRTNFYPHILSRLTTFHLIQNKCSYIDSEDSKNMNSEEIINSYTDRFLKFEYKEPNLEDKQTTETYQVTKIFEHIELKYLSDAKIMAENYCLKFGNWTKFIENFKKYIKHFMTISKFSKEELKSLEENTNKSTEKSLYKYDLYNDLHNMINSDNNDLHNMINSDNNEFDQFINFFQTKYNTYIESKSITNINTFINTILYNFCYNNYDNKLCTNLKQYFENDHTLDGLYSNTQISGIKVSRILVLQISPFKQYPNVDKILSTIKINNQDITIKDNTYTLFAMSVHTGFTKDSGHYIAYNRLVLFSNKENSIQNGKTWICANDSTITQMNLDDINKVLNQKGNTPILLLYELKVKHEGIGLGYHHKLDHDLYYNWA
jgi:hypothetical protein